MEWSMRSAMVKLAFFRQGRESNALAYLSASWPRRCVHEEKAGHMVDALRSHVQRFDRQRCDDGCYGEAREGDRRVGLRCRRLRHGPMTSSFNKVWRAAFSCLSLDGDRVSTRRRLATWSMRFVPTYKVSTDRQRCDDGCYGEAREGDRRVGLRCRRLRHGPMTSSFNKVWRAAFSCLSLDGDRCVHQEKAGHMADAASLPRTRFRQTDNAVTMAAMVKLAREIDESASDVVVYGMVR